jgi:hypothetical protein
MVHNLTLLEVMLRMCDKITTVTRNTKYEIPPEVISSNFAEKACWYMCKPHAKNYEKERQLK